MAFGLFWTKTVPKKCAVVYWLPWETADSSDAIAENWFIFACMEIKYGEKGGEIVLADSHI